MKKLLIALAATTFATSAALAQVTFESVDADASGTISAEEAATAGLAEDVFTTADADGSGDLSPEEFATIAQ